MAGEVYHNVAYSITLIGVCKVLSGNVYGLYLVSVTPWEHREMFALGNYCDGAICLAKLACYRWSEKQVLLVYWRDLRGLIPTILSFVLVQVHL